MSGFALAAYPLVVGAWRCSREEAYQSLGVGIRCRGHAARCMKSVVGAWFLKCRLRDSDPPCPWSRVLVQLPMGGGFELRSDGAEHDEECELGSSWGRDFS